MSLLHYSNLHVSKSAIWRTCRLPRYPSVISFRSFYIPARPGDANTATVSLAEKADRLSGTWYIPDPANIDYKNVLARFPQLPPIRRQRLTSALFLVTPGVAKWFESSHPFYQGAINHIYQPVLSESPPESIVAVVDALPSPRLPEGTLPLPGNEGIAICLSPDRFSTTEYTEVPSEQSLIRFHTPPGLLNDVEGSMVSVTLPTANTLFVNGLASTMFKQEWTQGKAEEQNIWVPKDAPIHLSSLNVMMPFTPTRFKGAYIPMQPITPARRIVSSMGNVLRELEGDDGTTLRGSTELESNVPQFIKKKEAEGLAGAVKVFALVMPPPPSAAAAVNNPEVQSQPAEDESKPSPVTTTSGDIHGSLAIKALRSGGRIVRVTGGGGGWGKKQGLLSLDDKVNFNTDESLESGMFPSFEEEIVDQQLFTPQELLQPGHTIQFFAAWIGPLESDEQVERFLRKSPAASYTARMWSKIREQKWILGTNLASEDAEPQMRDAEPVEINKRTTGVYAVARYFGMLSNRGVCLARETVQNQEEIYTAPSPRYNTMHQFRIDVPHTVLRCSWQGPRPPQEFSSPTEQEAQEPNADPKPIKTSGKRSSGSVARNVRSLIRDNEDRVTKVGKSREIKLVQGLDSGQAYRGGDVVGWENLDNKFRIFVPRSQPGEAEEGPRWNRSDRAGNRLQSKGAPRSSDRSDRVESRRDRAGETHPESFATAKSAGGIAKESLDPIFSLYEAPNKVSWDRPRANVKPGQSRPPS